MSKFKVDKARTVGGHDAVIFEITDHRIFGKAYVDGWVAMSWLPDGTYMSLRESNYDLLPNVEPLREVFEGVVRCTEDGLNYIYLVTNIFKSGDNVKVTLEETLNDPKIRCFFGYHTDHRAIRHLEYFDKVIVCFICSDCLKFCTLITSAFKREDSDK